MRSRNSVTVSDRQVQMLAEDWLRTAMPLRDVGWKCTSRRLWQIVLLAAARMSSVFAVCRDLVGSSLRSGGSQRPDGLFAGASADARTVAASGALRAAVARGDLSQSPAGRHRLASDPLPRTAAPACQRTVSQPAQVGDEQISRLRHGLRRRTGLSLHPRCDVGQRERVAAGRARTVARSSAGAGAEDQSSAAGSAVFQPLRCWNVCSSVASPF